MDKSLIIINQIKKDLKILEQEESELEEKLQIAHNKTTELNSDYYCSQQQLNTLTFEKQKVEEQTIRLKRERTLYQKEALFCFAASLIVNLILLGASIEKVAIFVLVGATIHGTVYIARTHGIRKVLKKIKNINWGEIQEQIEKLNELINEKDNERSLAEQNEDKIKEQLRSKKNYTRVLKQEILNQSAKRNQAIDEILGNSIEPQMPASKKPNESSGDLSNQHEQPQTNTTNNRQLIIKPKNRNNQ